MAFVWSEEAIARLTALHGKGLSGAELARALGGGLTRSAIFGKLHRLGLTGAKSAETGRLVPRLAALALRASRSSSEAVAHQKIPRSSAAPGVATSGYGPMKFNFARQKRLPSARGLAAAASPDASLPASDGPPPPPSLQIPLLDVKRGQCRFIAGDDGRACGHKTLAKSSWCPAHYRTVFAAEDAA